MDANPNVQTLQSLAIARPIDTENSQQTTNASASSDIRSSTPPPIPPRPVSIKMNGNRASMDAMTRANLQQRLPAMTAPLLPPPPPPLHNSDLLLLPQKSSMKTQLPPPLSSASSSESLNDSLGKIKLPPDTLLFLIPL